MRTKIFPILLIIAVLASLFATAAVPAPSTRRLSLLSTAFLHEKGVTFMLQADGEFKKSEFKGATLSFDGKSLKVYCNYNEGNPKVTCTAPSGTAKFAGQFATLQVSGFYFGVVIPARNR